MYIDTHCHFDVSEFDHDRLQVAERSAALGVEAIVIPGYRFAEWPKLFDVCKSIQVPQLLAAPGLHPCYIEEHAESHLLALESLLQSEKCVAVGEIGLDFFVPTLKQADMIARQKFFFIEQMKLAEKYQLPIILHVRKAHAEILALLKNYKFSQGGIVHAFSGGIEEAKHYAALGFCLGIGGPITYPQARRLHDVVEKISVEYLVLETDAPDMIPYPCRIEGVSKQRNSPEYLPIIAEALADSKKISLAEMIEIVKSNSQRVLRL